jgi:hypothetical protein
MLKVLIVFITNKITGSKIGRYKGQRTYYFKLKIITTMTNVNEKMWQKQFLLKKKRLIMF